MPPKPIDLPDIPDDFIEPDYKLIKNNLFTGAYASYLDGWDENRKTKVESQVDAVLEEQEREMIAEAEMAEVVKPKALGKKSTNIAVRKAVPGKANSATSRPTSRVGRQTPTFSSRPGTAQSISGARPKTPTASSTRNTNSRIGSTSRPTTRVGNTTISKPTSRVGAKSNGNENQVGNRGRSSSTAAPIEGESEEALSRLVFADVAGDESDHERVDVADLVLEGE